MSGLSNEQIVERLFDAFENSATLGQIYAEFEKNATILLSQCPSMLQSGTFLPVTVAAAEKVVDLAFDVWDDVYVEKDVQLDERVPYEAHADIAAERNDLDLSGLVILTAFRTLRPTLIALVSYLIEAAGKDTASHV